jgi:hypothetical protein
MGHDIWCKRNVVKQAIAHGGERPETILETVNQAIEGHCAGYRQSDDLTMNVLLWNK